jgi:multiple sugar transport system permease protein
MNRVLLAYALIAPAMLWRAGVALYPFLRSVAQAFTNESPLTPVTRGVGLRNFQDMLSDPAITDSLNFTVIFTVASTALQLIYALAIASLLNRRFRGRTIVRAVNLLPWAMPAIVIATASQWMFNYQYGMINDLIIRVLPDRPLWLVDPNLARIAVILVDTWKSAPWASIILLASLQNIPNELYEAAKIDGASSWRTFRSITLPLLSPMLITLTIFIATARVLTFDIVYGLTQGGPGAMTSLLSWQVYQLAFTGMYYGYAASVAVFSFVIVVAISLLGLVCLRWANNSYMGIG